MVVLPRIPSYLTRCNFIIMTKTSTCFESEGDLPPSALRQPIASQKSGMRSIPPLRQKPCANKSPGSGLNPTGLFESTKPMDQYLHRTMCKTKGKWIITPTRCCRTYRPHPTSKTVSGQLSQKAYLKGLFLSTFFSISMLRDKWQLISSCRPNTSSARASPT